MAPSRIALSAILLAVVVVAVAAGGYFYFAGGSYSYRLTNVSGHQPDLKLFGARNSAGRPRKAADYSGQVVVLYFGYTHCPNVCPETLAKLHAALNRLGKPSAGHVQLLFETADPKRDTRKQLAQYTRAFDPRFTGLRLTGKPLHAFERRYHISVSFGRANARGDYTVNHSSGVFVFDGHGTMRLIGSGATPVADWAHDLRHLVVGLQ